MKTMNPIISTSKVSAAVGAIQDLLQQVSGERIRRDIFFSAGISCPFAR